MDSSIYVTTHELGVGLKRAPCPYCSNPILIRLPSMAAAIADQDSAALRLGFDDLTPTERKVFDILHGYYPQAVSRAAVCAALDDLSPVGLRQHVARLRRKLEASGWLVISAHKDSYRLIEPAPLVDVATLPSVRNED